jgi:hypothetical protein
MIRKIAPKVQGLNTIPEITRATPMMAEIIRNKRLLMN